MQDQSDVASYQMLIQEAKKLKFYQAVEAADLYEKAIGQLKQISQRDEKEILTLISCLVEAASAYLRIPCRKIDREKINEGMGSEILRKYAEEAEQLLKNFFTKNEENLRYAAELYYQLAVIYSIQLSNDKDTISIFQNVIQQLEKISSPIKSDYKLLGECYIKIEEKYEEQEDYKNQKVYLEKYIKLIETCEIDPEYGRLQYTELGDCCVKLKDQEGRKIAYKNAINSLKKTDNYFQPETYLDIYENLASCLYPETGEFEIYTYAKDFFINVSDEDKVDATLFDKSFNFSRSQLVTFGSLQSRCSFFEKPSRLVVYPEAYYALKDFLVFVERFRLQNELTWPINPLLIHIRTEKGNEEFQKLKENFDKLESQLISKEEEIQGLKNQLNALQAHVLQQDKLIRALLLKIAPDEEMANTSILLEQNSNDTLVEGVPLPGTVSNNRSSLWEKNNSLQDEGKKTESNLPNAVSRNTA